MTIIALPALIALICLLVYAFSSNGKVCTLAIVLFAIFSAICALLYLSHGSVTLPGSYHTNR